MTSTFRIGCNGRGAQQSSLQRPVALEEASIDEQFRLVKEAGVFDYFDRLPSAENLDEYRKAIDKYDLPVLTASWFYRCIAAQYHDLYASRRWSCFAQ